MASADSNIEQPQGRPDLARRQRGDKPELPPEVHELLGKAMVGARYYDLRDPRSESA